MKYLFLLLISFNLFAGLTPNIPGGGGGGGTWGTITGTLSSQTDLQGALDGKVNYFPLKAPTGVLADPPSYGFLGGDDDTGIYSTGDGNISFQANGFHRFKIEQNDSTFTGDVHFTGNIDAANYPPTGTANRIAHYDTSGDLNPLPDYYISSDGFTSFNRTFQPNADGARSFVEEVLNLDPLQNSNAETYTFKNFRLDIDPNSTGFNIGTGGQAASFFNFYMRHQGTSNTGALDFFRLGSDIGNGTDPITVNGYAHIFGFGHIYNGVTVTGPVQGYGFQIQADATSVISNEVRAFYDFSNFQSDHVDGYTFAYANGNVAKISDNHNYNFLIGNAQIGLLEGNAGVNGLSLRPQVTAIGTGHFQMIDIRPELLSGTSNNNTLMNIDASQIPGTNNRAAQFTGNVDIQGDLSFSGALALGQLNAFATLPQLLDGGGNPTSIHSLISSVTNQTGVTVANADTLGANTATLIELKSNSHYTSGPLSIGLVGLALPAVIRTETGSTGDFMGGAAFALSLDGTSTGGTIGQGYGGMFTAIPNGITTFNRFYGLWPRMPFGALATDNWGVYSEAVFEKNYFGGDVKIGGADTLSNANFGIESEKTIASVNGFQVETSGTQPTCDVAHRGLMWNIEGGPGVADIFQICQKDATNAYAWVNH